jgi:sec-independent protein translocase protein TatA
VTAIYEPVRLRTTGMFAFLEGPELLIVLAIVVLIFGSTQLPKLARSLGQAQREFKGASAEVPPDDAKPPSNSG